jgi:histidine phosphotransferase ChpT
MTDNQPDLAALLCSRLCHDLLSPVGAMNNGIELMADEQDPDMRARCLELLADSAKAAADKLKFFRLAFGAAGGFGAEVDPGEAKEAISSLVTGNGRTQLEWMVPPAHLPKGAVKIMLNLIYIANEALLRGGVVNVAAERRGGTTEIVVRAEGPRLVMDANIRRALSGELAASEIDSRTAAAWMVSNLAKQGGGMVQIANDGDNGLIIGAMVMQAA